MSHFILSWSCKRLTIHSVLMLYMFFKFISLLFLIIVETVDHLAEQLQGQRFDSRFLLTTVHVEVTSDKTLNPAIAQTYTVLGSKQLSEYSCRP